MWVLTSVPVFTSQLLSLYFLFCAFRWEGLERQSTQKRSFWFPSVFGKGSFLVPFSFGEGKFWISSERGIFNTGSGSRAPLYLFFAEYIITGTWGPARVLIFFQKWTIRKMGPLSQPLMERHRLSWTMNSELPSGCVQRIYRWSVNPPY